MKVPHIGWSRLSTHALHEKAILFKKTLQNQFAYFVHSYHPLPLQTHLLATTLYNGHTIHSVVMNGNIMGCQFQPEKSGANMLTFLSDMVCKSRLALNVES
jgi:glutamine amidotransferase